MPTVKYFKFLCDVLSSSAEKLINADGIINWEEAE